MVAAVLLVVASFAAMEAVAYVAHRCLMHGRGRGAAWHVPHHQVRRGRFEANDLYPVVAGVATTAAIAVGTWVDGWSALVWVGAGVTAYGLAYLFVHDVYIHGRLGWRWRWAPLEPVREAHRIHHLWGAEPYGFLFPIVPADVRARAGAVSRDPLQPAAR